MVNSVRTLHAEGLIRNLLKKIWSRLCFDNRNFWNRRYSKNPDLGSGVGSRGLALKYKRDVLEQAVDMVNPMSVLDAGCGDMAFSTALPAKAYTGVDISKVVIQKNIVDYPDRRFVCGDFLKLDLSPANLVVSFDVLIHLKSKQYYESFVQKLISLSETHGIISGYEAKPKVSSRIIFFHEPLSQTLQKAGARSIEKIGEYNETGIFKFEAPSGLI